MRILIDNQIFNWQVYGGISRYFTELNSAFLRLGEDSRIVAPISVNAYLNKSQGRIHGFTINQPKHGNRLLKLANQVLFDISQSWLQPDIIHHTYYRVNRTKNSLHAITVYDMIHEVAPMEFPDSIVFRKIKEKAILNSDIVIAISESTKNDLVKFVGVSPEKVHVVHLAASFQEVSPSDRVIPSPYILYVGVRSLYKNFNNYIIACSLTKYTGKFVFFGGGKFRSDEENLINKLGLSSRVIQLSGDDYMASVLYKQADAFVFPSKYEGFGIPLLEAYFQKCRIAASNIDVFKEIMGDLVEYFDPNYPESIAQSIENLLNSEQPTAQSAAHMRAKFSWDNCAIQTLRAYASAKG